MTVSELIEALRKEPQDARVVVDGYEGGVDDANSIRQLRIRVNATKHVGYWGDHEDIHPDDTEEPFDEIAVRIGKR